MDEVEPVETVEIDAERFIALEGAREWPHYVMYWSVRQRSGDSDFPLANGRVQRLPPPDGSDAWSELRAEALAQAQVSEVDTATPAPRRPWWRRIFS